MHEACVEINKVPTTISTWGRWIEEIPAKENEDIILLIPGNPGVTGYYRKFLSTIYKELQCPVWVISHAGHQKIKSDAMHVPVLEGNEKLYDLQAQIDNKVDFFRKYIPAGARVHLIGHSIGAYICLHLLKHPEIKAKVTKAYLLFPTLENMVETPNGQFLMNIIRYIVWIILFFSWVFTCLPDSIQTFCLYCYCKVTCAPNYIIPSTKDLIHPTVLDKVFFMGHDEMKLVRSIDPDLIESSKDKIKLYYGANDNWAPVEYCKKLMRQFPGLDAEICTRNFDHAFVLRSSEAVGKMVAGWIELKN